MFMMTNLMLCTLLCSIRLKRCTWLLSAELYWCRC